MMQVKSCDLDHAIQVVLNRLNGVSELYPDQYALLQILFEKDNIFYTNGTNSGKTIPAVIFPDIIKQLNRVGYKFPPKPKVLFVTALNALQLSLLNNVKTLGISCGAVTSTNIKSLINSDDSVLFISPEILKLPDVTKTLLQYRTYFVLKVVDECHLGI